MPFVLQNSPKVGTNLADIGERAAIKPHIKERINMKLALLMTAGMMTACFAQDLTFTKTIDLNSKTDQMRVIAITLLSEARGEGDEGLKRVAQVIGNRARLRRTNPAIECLKPYQFQFWNHAPSRSQCLKLLSHPQSDFAMYLAAELLEGKEIVPLFGATHFHSGTPPKWAYSTRMRFVEKFKHHTFYKEI